MTREAEVAIYLRTDATLATLAPGGVYALSDMAPSGIANPDQAGDVWTGGVFNTTIVVRERASVPTGDLQGIESGRTSMSQVVEVWAYSLDSAAIEAALDRVYALMMGKRLTRAFSATLAGGMPLTDAPELISGVKTRHEDYRVVSIRIAAAI